MLQTRGLPSVRAPSALDRLGVHLRALAKEPSTWSGIALIGGAVGMHIDPAHLQEIATVGMGVAGAVFSLFRTSEDGV
ncbi:MAG: hypothetical protein HQL66_03195 [Magnetococcales bacterium]|nr:hypothetical protein [Magnetococcales bacterium]